MLPLPSQEEIIKAIRYNSSTGVFTHVGCKTGTTKDGNVAGSNHHKGYMYISIGGQRYPSHRLAWKYMYGRDPVGQIDHINRIKDDNRVCNLRQATNGDNKRNTPPYKNKQCSLKGVSKSNNKFKSQIRYNGEYFYLGVFDTEEEAHIAYTTKLHELIPHLIQFFGKKAKP